MTDHEAREALAAALEEAERTHRIVGQELARYRVKAQVGTPTSGLADAAEEASRALEDVGADLDAAIRAHEYRLAVHPADALEQANASAPSYAEWKIMTIGERHFTYP